MKKIFAYLMLVAFMAFFASCSSDKGDDEKKITQTQLDAIIGTWTLVEYDVNPPQDVNNDDTASSNLVDEMDCLSGTLVFTEEFTWSSTSTQLNITPITGDDFGIVCTTQATNSGDWFYLDGNVVLEEGSSGTFQLSGTTLTRNLGNDLPGINKVVYQKQ